LGGMMSECNEIDLLEKEVELDLRLAAAAAARAASKARRSALRAELVSRLEDYAGLLFEAADQVRKRSPRAEPPRHARNTHALGFARKIAEQLRAGLASGSRRH